jgi:Flp pilus assembly CpaE family ATPase
VSRRTFVVVGAKGGVGATSIAIGLALRLPAVAERLIVDADFAGRRSLAAWYDLSRELDDARADGLATVATARDGALVMELARTYEEGLVQTATAIIRTLAGFSEHALIVVDAPTPLAAAVRPFIVAATHIIVLTESSPMGVAAAASVLTAMDRFGIAESSVSLVLSNLVREPAVSRAEVERTIGKPVLAELGNKRDPRCEALFDDFMHGLVAAPAMPVQLTRLAEKPAMDRRAESRQAFL